MASFLPTPLGLKFISAMRRFSSVSLFIFLSVLTSYGANAQGKNPLRLGVGIAAGSTVKAPARLVLGADARLQIPLGNSFSGIITAGYYHFLKNDKAGNGFGIVPAKAGLKYFPVKNVYIAGEAGVGFGTKTYQKNSFMYSPSAGLAFGNGLDISIKYEEYTRYDGYASQLALRLAYGFKL